MSILMPTEADFRECLRISDERKAALKKARAECQADPALCARLLAEARRRGQSEIDWPSYFRNAHLV